MKLFVQSYFQLEVKPPSQTSDTLRAGFEPEQNLSSDSIGWRRHITAAAVHKKIKFSFNDFSSKCEQIRIFLWICLHLLKKSLTETFIVQCNIQGSCLILCWSAYGFEYFHFSLTVNVTCHVLFKNHDWYLIISFSLY